MGNAKSVPECLPSYTIPMEPIDFVSEDGSESCIFRSANHPSALLYKMPSGKVNNAWDVFLMGMRRNEDQPLFGTRRRLEDGSMGDYDYISYRQVQDLVCQLGNGLLKLDLVPEEYFPDEVYVPAQLLKVVGILARNCTEWFLIDLASHAFGFTSVALYETFGHDVMEFVIEQVRLHVLFAASSNLHKFHALMLKRTERSQECFIRNIVLIDDVPDSEFIELVDLYKVFNIKLFRWSAVLAAGADLAVQATGMPADKVATICYTSGTMGRPKGVLLTQRAFAAQVAGALQGPLSSLTFNLQEDESYISYLPLSHVFERAMCLVMIARGYKIPIATGVIEDLLSDVKAAQPTIFASVPRLFIRINDSIQNSISSKPAFMQYLFNYGLQTKLENLRATGTVTHFYWDSLLFREVRNLMGGKLRFMVCGGAAIEPEIQERMACFFSAPLLQGYGLTETLGATCLSNPQDNVYGHIGANLPMNEFKIVSLPELAYVVEGPSMRGELLIRGHSVFVGYFRNEAATKAVLDDDGWLATGDIVVREQEHGRLRIIDRKSNMYKLSQGEFVSPEKVECIISESPLISQSFVYGQVTKSFLVAIIVVSKDKALMAWQESEGIVASPQELISSQYEKLYAVVEAELSRLFVKAKLVGFEKVKKFYMTFDEFTVENEMLTPTQKLRRRNIEIQYAKVLQDLYSTAEAKSIMV